MLRRLRSHGITRDPSETQGEIEGGWSYQQLDLGFNYRMTDLQAALGASQMNRIDEFVARRKTLVERYRTALAVLPLKLPEALPETNPAWHLQVVTLEQPAWRKPLYDGLRTRGIEVNVHYKPVYLQPFYRALGFKPGHCREAEFYYDRALTLPLFAAMSDRDFDTVIDSLTNTLNRIAL
jgi:dTDP-4-amino-4,6-dideoxygalactose transaminase